MPTLLFNNAYNKVTKDIVAVACMEYVVIFLLSRQCWHRIRLVAEVNELLD